VGYGIYRHFQQYFSFIVEETGVPGENHRSDKLYHMHNVILAVVYIDLE
jgi:hypothetical protein